MGESEISNLNNKGNRGEMQLLRGSTKIVQGEGSSSG